MYKPTQESTFQNFLFYYQKNQNYFQNFKLLFIHQVRKIMKEQACEIEAAFLYAVIYKKKMKFDVAKKRFDQLRCAQEGTVCLGHFK